MLLIAVNKLAGHNCPVLAKNRLRGRYISVIFGTLITYIDRNRSPGDRKFGRSVCRKIIASGAGYFDCHNIRVGVDRTRPLPTFAAVIARKSERGSGIPARIFHGKRQIFR